MGVAAEILQDLLRTPPRRFGVDDPGFGVEVLQEGGPGGVLGQWRTLPGKGQPLLAAQPLQPSEILAPEDLAQGLHGKEKAPPTGAPLRTIRTHAPARDHAVDMDMLGQRLAPRVEYGSDAQFRPKCLGSRANSCRVWVAVWNKRV